MYIQYYKEHSDFLKREMEFKVYGHARPVCLAFSCEGGRFYDWEDRGLVGSLGFLIDAGRLRLVCADSIDGESWLADGEGRAGPKCRSAGSAGSPGSLHPVCMKCAACQKTKSC